jgi:hypothetical protein
LNEFWKEFNSRRAKYIQPKDILGLGLCCDLASLYNNVGYSGDNLERFNKHYFNLRKDNKPAYSARIAYKLKEFSHERIY